MKTKKEINTEWSQVKLIILGISGVIAVIALALFITTNNSADAPVTDAVRHGEALRVPESWRTLSDSKLNISIRHPREVRAEEEEGQVTFTLFGPNNTTGSVVTDGFSFKITNENYSGSPSFSAYVEGEYTEELQKGEGILEPTISTFQDRSAFAFVVGSEETETEHVYVEHGQNTTLHLSWNVNDPSGRGYAGVIDTMFATLSFESSGEGAPVFTHVELALLNTTPDGEPARGCDNVVLIEREVLSPTTQPLNTALSLLFSLDVENIDGNLNFISRTNSTLQFSRATLENGTASIFLEGELTGLVGVCDNLRAKIQIEETALNFSTINNVRIFVNGSETELLPSDQ